MTKLFAGFVAFGLFLLASRFGDGAVCIATEGRVKPDNSWFHPRAEISVPGLVLRVVSK